jgi:hypothetical protein
MKKITFRVPPTLWASFTLQTQKLFINRGPFLDHMLSIELPYVTKDLGDYKMTAKARRYISGLLKKKDPTIVNVEIQDSTAQLLNDIVEKHSLLRDALLCRLIIFVRSSDALLKYLEVPRDVTSFGARVESLSTSPMKAIEQIYSDPLFYVRSHLNSPSNNCGVYNCTLMNGLEWASCYLDNENVPNTKEYKQRQKELEELSKEFDYDLIQMS